MQYRRVLILLGLLLVFAIHCPAAVQEGLLLVSSNRYLDAFQFFLSKDIAYTNYSLMYQAAHIALEYGISTNGQWFSFSNPDGETRTYYFPIENVLIPFTNQYHKDLPLWELLSRYYGIGLWKGWFSTPKAIASNLLLTTSNALLLSKRTTPDIFAYQALAYLALGNTNQAVFILSNALNQYPSNFYLFALQASILRANQRYDEALHLIQRNYPFIKNRSQQEELFLLSAQLYLDLSQPQEALFLMERLLSTTTNQQGLFFLLEASARLTNWQRFNERALLLFELNPTSDTVSRISEFFIRFKSITWGEIFFETAIDYYDDPLTKGTLLFYWAEVYRNLGITQKALSTYEQAREQFLLITPPPTESITLIDMMIYKTKNP